MFVPRAVRLKGVKEGQRPRIVKPQTKPESRKDETNSKDALVEAMGETSMNSPAAQQDTASYAPAPTRGPRFTTKPVTPEYIAQLAAGIELIFTDYAHQDEERWKWLSDHFRVVQGEKNYVHLTAILEHPNISKLKPEATQILLKQALHDHSSVILESSQDGYYVRRKPSTNPLPFVPENSFEVVDDDGLSFWDQRTIYVEPHLRAMCSTPAKVAQWLAEHGRLRPKWLPIQAVHTLWNSCAFVVLSGNVMHEEPWNKWRDTGKPDDWKIMTKVEHTKRTAEYLALLEKSNPNGMPKRKDSSQLPPIARPATLPMAFDPLLEVAEVNVQGKKKRKRQKPANASDYVGDDGEKAGPRPAKQATACETDVRMIDTREPQPDEVNSSTNKKKRKRRKPANKTANAEEGAEHAQKSALEEPAADTHMDDAREPEPDAVNSSTNKKKRKRRKSAKPDNVSDVATDAVTPEATMSQTASTVDELHLHHRYSTC